MNLKFKFGKKLTAVCEFTSDTQAIFSDECSPTSTNTLRIIENKDGFDALLEEAKELAIELASATRFKPVIALIQGKYLQVEELKAKVELETKKEKEKDSGNPFIR